MAKFQKECEYCGDLFDTDNENEEYGSEECRHRDEQFRRAEEAADRKFEEMAYGPQDDI